MSLSLAEYVQRWKLNSQSERSGAQSHFIDLCDLLGEDHPAASDSIGERYAFEKPVGKTKGGKGFADVWLRDHFAWEYKGKHKNLAKAYEQLNDYREDLGNPPLLVVCDLDRFEIHTNFTATSKRVYAFNLDDLNRNVVTATCPLPPLTVLRALFADYNVLRPDRTDAQVTQDAAKLFSRLAERLELEDRNLGASRQDVAHFLMRLLFCFFADSIGLLPNKVFRSLIVSDRHNPKRFLRKLSLLFEAMSQADGIFGEHTVKYFNGGLFDSSSVVQLDSTDLGILWDVSKNYDWSHIAPAIFGTLFERSLDPARRSLIGAHYTSAEDILLLIEPVLMKPLEARWANVRLEVIEALTVERAEEAARTSRQARIRTDLRSEKLLADWIHELTTLRVLDPACGSGNFLYLALRRMLDLWLEATRFAAEQRISLVVPAMVSPSQLFGIETEFYAHELASVVVWIGFLQWRHEHSIHEDREPILQRLGNIEHDDAILRYDQDNQPYEPAWPVVDVIIGNPPFLGDKLMRRELNNDPHITYVDDLRKIYEGRVPGGADLVTYWFEKARHMVETGPVRRCGLLATQGIRGGLNRVVLERIKETGDIFWAYSDRNWTLNGAMVHVSMIGFDSGAETVHQLNGEVVEEIHSNLTAGANSTAAVPLLENENLCFIGTQKGGPFNIDETVARKMLSAPVNVNGKPNSDVVHPWANAFDVTHRSRNMYIIDFGVDMAMEQASLYEMPFEYIKKHVMPGRADLRRSNHRDRWWIHAESRPGFRRQLSTKRRFAATARHSKHRFFVWLDAGIVPDSALVVVTREDDYFMGVLSSDAHEVWSRSQGTQVREVESGFRYTPRSVFDTFPFPWAPGHEPSEGSNPHLFAIAESSRELTRLRDAWLNPSGASNEDLKTRTLTALYNKMPEWLRAAHSTLNKAVFTAYGWPLSLNKQELLTRLLELNSTRASSSQTEP